mmetsp:Transcript_15442/g.58455  ORF Transcript_15442/g.58455 Transcript_15442/m.58455 type:complete len:273 (+) Transcript_15442:3006-3824(+)
MTNAKPSTTIAAVAARNTTDIARATRWAACQHVPSTHAAPGPARVMPPNGNPQVHTPSQMSMDGSSKNVQNAYTTTTRNASHLPRLDLSRDLPARRARRESAGWSTPSTLSAGLAEPSLKSLSEPSESPDWPVMRGASGLAALRAEGGLASADPTPAAVSDSATSGWAEFWRAAPSLSALRSPRDTYIADGFRSSSALSKPLSSLPLSPVSRRLPRSGPLWRLELVRLGSRHDSANRFCVFSRSSRLSARSRVARKVAVTTHTSPHNAKNAQ